MERCFLFSKDLNKVKNFLEILKISDEQHEKIIQKTAEILGLPKIEKYNNTTIITSTRGTPLISNLVGKEHGFMNKLKELSSKDFEIHDKKGIYLGQWCEIKGNRKEFKEISKFINTLNLYKDKYGFNSIPNIVDEILDGYRFKGKYAIMEGYGVFFIVDDESIVETEKFKKIFKDAVEYRMSDFYRIRESGKVK